MNSFPVYLRAIFRFQPERGPFGVLGRLVRWCFAGWWRGSFRRLQDPLKPSIVIHLRHEQFCLRRDYGWKRRLQEIDQAGGVGFLALTLPGERHGLLL